MGVELLAAQYILGGWDWLALSAINRSVKGKQVSVVHTVVVGVVL